MNALTTETFDTFRHYFIGKCDEYLDSEYYSKCIGKQNLLFYRHWFKNSKYINCKITLVYVKEIVV